MSAVCTTVQRPLIEQALTSLQAVADIIDDCLQRHPEKRPSAEELFHRLQAT